MYLRSLSILLVLCVGAVPATIAEPSAVKAPGFMRVKAPYVAPEAASTQAEETTAPLLPSEERSSSAAGLLEAPESGGASGTSMSLLDRSLPPLEVAVAEAAPAAAPEPELVGERGGEAELPPAADAARAPDLAGLQSAPEEGSAVEPLALGVEEAVARALAEHPRALVAEADVAATEAAIAQAESQRLPRINSRAAYSYVEGLEDDIITLPILKNVIGVNNLRPKPHSLTTQVSLQQTLYAGGQIQAGIRASEYLAESQEWQREAALQELAYDTREAYYSAVLGGRLVEVARESVQTFEHHLQDAQELLDAGAGTRFEVLRADTELNARRTSLESARVAREIALLNLRRLVGVEESVPLVLEDSLPATPMDMAVEDLLAQARAQRPELRALEAGIQAAEEQVTMRRAQYKPRAAATTQYQSVEGGGAALPDGWSITVGAEWEIFAGGRRKAEVAEARQKLRSLEFQRLDVERLVELDVRQAQLRVGEAYAKIQQEEATVALAEEALRLATLRFEEGVGVQTEILDTELALTKARTQLASANRDYAVALAALRKAAGEREGGGA